MAMMLLIASCTHIIVQQIIGKRGAGFNSSLKLLQCMPGLPGFFFNAYQEDSGVADTIRPGLRQFLIQHWHVIRYTVFFNPTLFYRPVVEEKQRATELIYPLI